MSRIEDQANYWKNLHLINRSIISVVHLEDKEDEIFWRNQLRNVADGEYQFIPFSKNNDGNDAKGCEQCLKFVGNLSPRFFICIDSDLRLLRQQKGLTPNNFIAQTYAYSWENHFCEAEQLQKRFYEKIQDSFFNFETFLYALSEVVYIPLLYLVHYKTPALNKTWNITKFNRCLPLQPSRKDLSENGERYIQTVKKNFARELANLSLPEAFSVDGLTPRNAYLHIQGHQLYRLIMHIGTLLCRGSKIAFKSEILDKARQTSGYEEINNVQADIRTILSQL